MTEAKSVEPEVEQQPHKCKRKLSARSWRKSVCTTAPKCSMINRHIQLAWEHMCCQRKARTKGVRGSSRFCMRAASDQLDCVPGEWLGKATLGQARSAGLNDVRFCVHRSRTQDGNSLWHLNYFEHLTLMRLTDGLRQACPHFFTPFRAKLHAWWCAESQEQTYIALSCIVGIQKVPKDQIPNPIKVTEFEWF